MENLSVAACVVAAIAIVLSCVSLSQVHTINGRADDLATLGVTQASSNSPTAAPSSMHQDIAPKVNKAMSALSLHKNCSSLTNCADLIESMSRLAATELSCDKVKNGHFTTPHFDVMVTENDKVLCNGPKFGDKTGETKPAPTNCDISVNNFCVVGKDSGIEAWFKGGRARRGQWSLDANAGWNQQMGANVQVGLSYKW